MEEQIIDIRERIEKMRIKFEDDDKSNFNNVSNDEKKVAYVEKKIINNLPNEEVVNHKNQDVKYNENKNLPKSETFNQNSNEFPSVQLSVKNPISSKVLVFLMLLQVFSNIGIFMLLLNVLE